MAEGTVKPRKRKRLSLDGLDFTDTAQIIAGEGGKPHVVPRCIIKQIPFFSAQASFNSKSGSSILTIDIEDWALDVYLKWLFQEELSSEDLAHRQTGQTIGTKLCRLWVVGDYIGDVAFQHEALSMLRGLLFPGYLISAAALQIAWEQTATDSLLRALLLEHSTWLDKENFERFNSMYPTAFISDLCGRLMDIAKGVDRTSVDWSKSTKAILDISAASLPGTHA